MLFFMRAKSNWLFLRAKPTDIYAGEARGSPSTPTPSCSLRRGFNPPPAPSLSREGSNRSSCRSFIKEPSDHQRSGVLSFGWRGARHEKSSRKSKHRIHYRLFDIHKGVFQGMANTAPAEGAHHRPFDGSGIPEKPDFGWAAGRSQLEPSLEREGAGGR